MPTIPSLPAATALTGAELIPVEQAGETRKMLASEFASAADLEYVGDPLMSTQRIGAATVNDGTTTIGSSVITLAEPIERDGNKVLLTYWGAAIGTSYVQIASRNAGTGVVTILREVAFTTAVGLNTVELTLDYYIGEYIGIRTSSGRIDISTGTETGYWSVGGAKVVGETYTDAVTDYANFKIAFDLIAPGVTAAEFQALKTQVGDADVADVAARVGEESPTLAAIFLPLASTPVTSALVVGGSTYVSNTPALVKQKLARLRAFVLTAGYMILRRYTFDGTSAWTQVGADATVFLNTTGPVDLTNLPDFTMEEGEYLGIYRGTAVIALTAGTDHPYYAGPSGGGNFTDSTTSTARFELGVYFSPVSLTSRVGELEEAVAALESGSSNSSALIRAPRVPLALPLILKAYNHRLSYGQSLSVGAAAGALLSTTQPYSNVTFAGGPRAWNGSTWDFGAFKPLVEDEVSPAPDAGTNRKETICSGSANYSSECLARVGIMPADHVILASTAGHGGYRIDQLYKASPWYANFLAHVSGAQALDTDHAVHAVDWLQGENDVNVKDFATYRPLLSQLQVDAEDDIQGITGQASPVYFLTYQVSFGVVTDPDIALAQLDLAQKNPKFFLTAPTYIFPHASDQVHLTAIGYKWLAAYHGRAYAELAQGYEPQWLNPLGAVVRGDEVRVRFAVPTLPLVLDTTALAVTADHGFVVTDGGVAATINTITVDGPDVVFKLASAASGAVAVRYAMDNLGVGLTVDEGASGNLRDSTPDTTVISGTTYPLWNVSPSFQLSAVALG